MRLRGGAEDDNGNIAGIPPPQISLPPQPHCTEHPLLFEIIISDHFATFQTNRSVKKRPTLRRPLLSKLLC